MATFTNNFYGGGKGYNLCLDVVTNSQNASNNTSNVTVTVRLVSLGSSYTISSSTSKSGSVTIDGTKYTFTFTAGLSGSQNKTLFTKTVDVSHNSDGGKTLSVSASCGINVTLSGTYYGTVTVSGSTTLTAIPRSTPVSISGSGTFGTSKWIGHTRASTAFTVTLRYVCGSSSGTIISKSATNETYWTPPKSLQSEIPKATSITITVYCDTYNGSTLIGTTSTSFTCYVASDCVPTISSGSFTCVETGGTTYYQTANRVRAEIGCSGAYGSTITKYVMTVDGQTLTNYGYIIWSGYLTGSGYKDISVTITDSRGKTASYTWSSAIYVTAYSKPVISRFTCKRMGYDENGDLVISNLGDHGYFSVSCSFHSNATGISRSFSYRASGTTSWTTLTYYSNSYTDQLFSKYLATGSAYELKWTASDDISTVEQTIIMQNVFPLVNMSADGTAIAFGKECNASDKFMVMMDASLNKHTDLWTMQVTSTSTFTGNATFNGQLLAKYGGATAQLNGDALYLYSAYEAIKGTSTTLYLNGSQHYSGGVHSYGRLSVESRGSNAQLVCIVTSDDGNGEGDGNTHLGYYMSGGYGHYFRGGGTTIIDTAGGLQCNKNLFTNAWLMADKMSYLTSGGWVDSNSSQTWAIGCSNHWLPMYDTRYLGTSAHRWQQLYCVSSPSVSSDARNKENVKYMHDQPEFINEYTDVKENDEITTHDLLDFVLNDLYMVTFDYKQNTDEMEDDEKEMVTAMNNRQIGFIAQDIENTKVGKYLVTKDKQGVLSYESSNWPSIIAGALQQEIRDRQAADKELMEMLNNIINE